jgi:hypothetical protein
MPTTVVRKPLTPHQAEVLGRIKRQSKSKGYARSQNIGSRGACQHLEEKGYISVSEVPGPRGGVTYRYAPVDAQRSLADDEVVFQATDGKWYLSTPTACGFKHTYLGKGHRNKDEAAKRALEVLSS